MGEGTEVLMVSARAAPAQVAQETVGREKVGFRGVEQEGVISRRPR